ncbi:MAG: hypothetical protein QXP59_01995 [Saccharolobus sp.]
MEGKRKIMNRVLEYSKIAGMLMYFAMIFINVSFASSTNSTGLGPIFTNAFCPILKDFGPNPTITLGFLEGALIMGLTTFYAFNYYRSQMSKIEQTGEKPNTGMVIEILIIGGLIALLAIGVTAFGLSPFNCS